MTKPRLLDLFCGAGGAAMGYHQAGFEVVGVDLIPQKHYPFNFVQADAFEYLADHWREYDVFHGSPPCQGYSIMNNLPWLAGKERAYLIQPLREALNAIGKPYVIENVMGARWGAKGLAKRGLEAHGMQAGWLCGTMFQLPFYRHRLFETNWFWLQMGHPKHQGVIRKGRNLGELQHDVLFSTSEDSRGIKSWPGRRKDGDGGHGMSPAKLGGMLPKSKGGNGILTLNLQQGTMSLSHGTNARWHEVAEAMGIDWMLKTELTQAIPPAYTRFIGEQLLKVLA